MQQEVQAHEVRRQQALIAADREALASLLAPDLIWTHATGATDSRDSYLAKLGAVRFLEIETLSQDVLVLGRVAAIKSELAMQLRLPDGSDLAIRSTASATWSLAPDGWTLRRFHSGNLA
jgi:ketosteroid isomerase-like protein